MPAPRYPTVDDMLRDVRREVRDERVLAAMRAVPRDAFVPASLRYQAYADAALAIGAGQTISQPLIVGIMTEALALTGAEHVLEVGTGSGYQAAVLARLAHDVVSVEVVEQLRVRAAATLSRLGVHNVSCLAAGETPGAPRHAPYDAIIVTAAAPAIPPPLLEQLRDGGRIVIPVGAADAQELTLAVKHGARLELRELGGCRFVPLAGPGGFVPLPPRSAPREHGRHWT